MSYHEDLISAATAAPPAERDAADPDHDVLVLAARGEAGVALRLLMQRHGRAVFRFCWQGLRDAWLAEDVHQQIFIEAGRDLASFGRRSALRAWLFGIARHRVLDAAKARGRAQAHLADTELDLVQDPRPSAADLVADAQLHEALAACVRELDDDDRTALLLRYQQGFSYEEMAVICREKPRTLHARVTRALPVLRRRIEARVGRIG